MKKGPRSGVSLDDGAVSHATRDSALKTVMLAAL